MDKDKKIKFYEPTTLIIGFVLAILSAIICMQIIVKVGTAPNTSLIGAIFALLIARIPFNMFLKYKSLDRQNYIQTITSGSGFAAANVGLLSIGIVFLLDEKSMIMPMLIGSAIGIILSIIIVGKLFDSTLFPAQVSWPPGIATAETIQAGDKGGDKAKRLLQGITAGIIGSFFKIPVGGIGVAFISNIFAITALGIGLIIRGYSTTFFNGFDIGNSYIPHGFIIGAGLVTLIQCLIVIFKKEKAQEKIVVTVDKKATQKNILLSVVLYIFGALILAIISGIYTSMPVSQLIIWLVFTGVSSTIATLLVGMSAMHSGWFPAFAISTIFLIIGIILGFPKISLALLTGYVCSVGPCFADMGFDLKTGWLLRGKGTDPEYELFGRNQQVKAELYGSLVGIFIVFVSMNLFFASNSFPPISGVFAKMIESSVNPEIMMTLVIWAIPGAILQLISGSKKMMGLLFSTGLLIYNPIYGIGILVAVVFRIIFGNKFMDKRDAGLIVGDGLFGFFSLVFKAFL